MKKLLALIVAVAMLATMSTTAFAAVDQDSADPNGSMNVTYSVAPTYTVTIPTDVTIDGNSTTISAENVLLNKGQYVSVTLAADNNFTVKTTEGAELTYTVTANGENIAAGDEILAVNPADGKTGSATVTFAIDESAIKYAGTYTGTATFTVAVNNAPQMISFKFYENSANYWSGDGEDYVVYTVLEGTTWGEWLASEDNIYNLTDGEDCIYAPGPAFLECVDKEAGTWVWPLVDDEIIADAVYGLGRF